MKLKYIKYNVMCALVEIANGKFKWKVLLE